MRKKKNKLQAELKEVAFNYYKNRLIFPILIKIIT